MTDLPEPPELAEAERRLLDAWTVAAPPAGFADRVVAARPAAVDPLVRRTRRRRLAGGSAAAAAAAAAALVAYGALGTHAGTHAAHGELAPRDRTTAQLGDRVVAVAEADASATWDIAPDGAGEVTQRAGDIFYRVDRGGPLVVHTPAGDLHVTGTCFRVEVEMNKSTQLILAGAAGAAVATGVVITVYEGHVIADTHTARTELSPGSRTELEPGGLGGRPHPDPVIASVASTFEVATATRAQLAARIVAAETEIARLRTTLVAAQGSGAGSDDLVTSLMGSGVGGRPWHAPSTDALRQWAAECHLRFDQPDLAPAAAGARGLTADELPEYNAAVQGVMQHFQALVRQLYVETTADSTGAESLSLDAMIEEIEDKAAPGEAVAVRTRIARERAGLAAPPTDLSHASPVERLLRARATLGDDTEAAVSKALGPERAAAIRGESWDNRNDLRGCAPPGP